jgi:hypothetical protein
MAIAGFCIWFKNKLSKFYGFWKIFSGWILAIIFPNAPKYSSVILLSLKSAKILMLTSDNMLISIIFFRGINYPVNKIMKLTEYFNFG